MANCSTYSDASTAAKVELVAERYEISLEFEIPNDTSLFSQVSDAVRDHLRRVAPVGESVQLEVISALEESLANAMIHGNLELPSEARRDHASFLRMIQQRRNHPPYCSRRVHVHVWISPERLEMRVRDEGAGFDPETIPDPRLEEPGASAWGIGLLLIRAFMDEVRHNPQGNEITMVRRFPRVAAT